MSLILANPKTLIPCAHGSYANDYAETITVKTAIRWRDIYHLPYTMHSPPSTYTGSVPFKPFYTTGVHTFSELKEYLNMLVIWIHENMYNYTYLTSAKYDWQIPYFYDKHNTIMFGDNDSINSEISPETITPTTFYTEYYWWKDIIPDPKNLNLYYDKVMVQSFIDEINEKKYPDDWLVFTN